MKTRGSSWSLAVCLRRLYRSALWIYPAGFRNAFGREMTDAFGDSCCQVRQRGRFHLLAHGIHALCELFFQGALERLASLRRAARERLPARLTGGGRHSAGRHRAAAVLESLTRDTLLALRGLRRSPGFASTVVIVLAICIGANTAIFSVVNGVLLKPLPYPDPDRLVNVWQVNDEWLDSPDPRFRAMGSEFPASYPVLEDWLESAEALQNVGGYAPWLRAMDFGDRVERVLMAHVTSGVFSALRVPPMMGRAIVERDDRIGADMVAVLSHGFWQSHYGGDSTVVGRSVRLDERTYLVVGVMPPGFYFPDPDCALWANFADEQKEAGRDQQFLQAIGRLRPGLSIDAAERETQALNQRLVEARGGKHEFGVRLSSRATQMVGDVRLLLLVVLGAVGMVLLIACANISSLMLMRATSRRRELALRAALGAGRGRLVRQLLIESSTVAALSGLLGLVLAFATFEPMLAWLPRGLPRLDEVALDHRVLLFSFGVAFLTALLVGIVPALNTSRFSFADVLKEGGRSVIGDVRRRRIQGALVTAQIAVAFVLLVGSGLLVKSFLRLTTVERGFDAANVLLAAIDLPGERYEDDGQRATFLQLLEERLSRLPGVRSVALATNVPFVGGASSGDVTIENLAGLREVNLEFSYVSPHYFRTLGIPLHTGHAFAATDDPDAELVAIVSASAATEYWPGEDPVGRRIRRGRIDGESGPWRTVVGVAGDTRLRLDREPRPRYYLPVAQSPFTYYVMAVKTAGDPAALTASVRSIVLELEPKVPVPTITTLEDRIVSSVAAPRLQAVLVTGLAALAGLLALVGVYGALSYATAQRTAEFGVRIALGARDFDVRRDVLGLGAALTGLGLMIGLGVALATVRVLDSLLFQTKVYDPQMFLGAAGLLSLAGLTASYVPARRATGLDPVDALRTE